MITREQLAGLQPGDVVELTHASHEGVTLRGPVRTHRDSRVVWVGDTLLTDIDGELRDASRWATLTVVSRAPRPLYVNHPRTEPVPGDVARQESGCPSAHTWHYLGDEKSRWWRFDDTRIPFDQDARLRLLVDGETGQVVP